jgi:hypothetical protein
VGQSRIHQALLDEAETLINLTNNSTSELSGIDFISEDWNSFDFHRNIVSTYEGILEG